MGKKTPSYAAIGDAAYRKHVAGRPSHGYRQQPQKLVKIECVVPEIYPLSVGKKTPSRRYAMRPTVNLSEEDRGTDKGNMHKKFGKDRACDSGDILADRQTFNRHTHRQTYSSQYWECYKICNIISTQLFPYVVKNMQLQKLLEI